MRTLPLVAAVVICSAAGLTAQQQVHQPAWTSFLGSGRVPVVINPATTTRHISLRPDGGTVELGTKGATDRQTLSTIRAELPNLETWFGAGLFQAPAVTHGHGGRPLSAKTSDMSRVKDKVHFAFADTPTGGRMTVTTSDPEALQAVYAFLRSLAGDLANGDSFEFAKR